MKMIQIMDSAGMNNKNVVDSVAMNSIFSE